VEVNVNWLPPLLDPIALNPKLISIPIVDRLDYDTLAYRKEDDGGRGIFNWDMDYRRFPPRPEDLIRPDAPIPTPVMTNAALAMNRQFFWDIGAYDSRLKMTNTDHFEMSFKAHLCARGIVECPCSRVGLVHRDSRLYKIHGKRREFAAVNLKRVVEVWLVSKEM
jgi:polypeptide N-acetylgalactosaminyltransferase